MKKQKLPFHIVLLGQITSGKDTQAEILRKKYDVYLVESGKYWRKLQKSKTQEGELLRKTTGKGKPAPVSLMKKFLIESMQKCPKRKTALFVGNPRLKPEAQLLLKIIKERKESVQAFYIALPEKEIYKRSSLRIRNIDDKKHVHERIRWHKLQVSKTVKFLEEKKILKKINGNQTIEKVSKDIEKQIQKWQHVL